MSVAHLVRFAVEVVEQSPALLRARARSSPLQHVDVRLQARQRRAQLVRGVGDEAALRLERLLERTEHRVEGAPRRAELVAARLPGTRSLGSPVSAIRSAAAVRRRMGTSVARETSAPPRRAGCEPASETRSEDRDGAGRACARCRPLDARAGRQSEDVAVAVDHASADGVDAATASCRPGRWRRTVRVLRGDSESLLRHRDLDATRSSADRRAVGQDDLDVRRRRTRPLRWRRGRRRSSNDVVEVAAVRTCW